MDVRTLIRAMDHGRVQVKWTDWDDLDGRLDESGWVVAIKGDHAVINCDCGPRTVRRLISGIEMA